jgi:hypothetical protein
MTTTQHFTRQRIVNEHKIRARALDRFEREQQCSICLAVGDWFKRAGIYLLNY